MKRLFLNILLFLILNHSIFSQIFYDRYVNFKIGQGFSFGGVGIAVEYRYKKLSLLGSIGYQREQLIYDRIVPSSWNVSGDIRYYLSKRDGNWQFFLGIHGGWLSNYYHPNIGESPYQYNVYGIALHSGIEIREELLNIEIGMGIDPGRLTFKPSKHPYYNTSWYIAPNIGIGINLYALQSRLKYNKKIKYNKKETPNQMALNNSESTLQNNSEDSIHIKLIKQQASVLLEQCQQAFKSQYDRVFYQNDTLYVWKPLGNKRNLFFKILLRNKQSEQFYCVGLNEKQNESVALLIQDDISTPAAEDLPLLMEELEHYSRSSKGLLCYYVKPPYLYLSAENAEFFYQNVNIKVDKILVCEIKF